MILGQDPNFKLSNLFLLRKFLVFFFIVLHHFLGLFIILFICEEKEKDTEDDK